MSEEDEPFGRAKWRQMASLCALAFFLAAELEPRQGWAEATAVKLDIAAQDLGSAMEAFAKQTKAQILFPSQIVNGLRTNGISGIYTPAAALRQLLNGTGLTIIPNGENNFILTAETSGKQSLPASSSTSNIEQAEDVVVTARRREEKAQDVPIPMTVLGGDALTATDTVRIEDIAQRLPSTNVTVSNPRQSSIAIRGIGNNPANDGLQPSVGVFLDGVYLGRPGMAVFDLTDLDQLEVLRGPQGTLFGKNTTAGALNITTKKPSFTAGGSVETTFGNIGDREVKASITGPLDDNQAVRLSVYDTSRDGLLHSVATGKDYDDRARYGARGQWLANIRDNLTLRFIAEYNNEGDRQGVSAPYKEINGAGVWAQNARYQADAAALGLNSRTLYQGHSIYGTDVYINDQQYMKVVQSGISLLTDYDLGNGFSLASITGFRNWNFYPLNDSDGSTLSLQPEAGGINHDKQFSQELRVSTPTGGPIDYTAGLYYFRQQERVHIFNVYGSYLTLLEDFLGSYNYATGIFTPATPATASSYLNKTVTTDSRLGTNSAAAFGQANWHLTDQLTLTGGLRNTYENNNISLWRNLGNTAAATAGNPNYQSVNYSKVDNNLSGTLALTYKLNDNISPYMSFSHGAKAGAMNSQPATGNPLTPTSIIVRPEKINDAELGFKSRLLNRRLTFNTNAFYNLVQDYQASGTVIDPATGRNTQTLLNTGWVQSKGVEIDSAYALGKGLTVRFNSSYNQVTYRSFRNGSCAAEYKTSAAYCDLTGRPVAGAPKWISALDTRYERSVADGWIGYIEAQYNYKSSFFGPWVQDDSAFSKVKGVGLTNLWIGTKLLNDQLDIALWVRNIFDKRYVLFTNGGTNGAYTAYPGDPIAVGMTTRVTF
ncbi:TonB-dependent receptor domain-containing protein [Telmatospirillum siberiense]|nr:TonB-dependent receptor [Telmatospirillum siberiense]